MDGLHIGLERLPAKPDFSTEHREMAWLYLDAVGGLHANENLSGPYHALTKGQNLLVARSGSYLAGLAMTNIEHSPLEIPVTSICWLSILATKPLFRGTRSVGPALISGVMDIAAQHEAGTVELLCDTNLTGFYQRNGFEVAIKGSYMNRMRRSV